MKHLFERNIYLMYAATALSWTRFHVSVLPLFYIASQVPLEEFMIIMAAYALIILFLEVPSGVVADILGKKNTLLIARSLYIIELSTLAFANGFWPFLFAKVISGVGTSLASGTTQALMYDSLKRLKREDDFKQTYGMLRMIRSIMMSFVFIIGAWLFTIDVKLPAKLSTIGAVLCVIVTCFKTEPYKSRKKLRFSTSWKHLRQCFSYFKGHGYVKYITFYAMSIAVVLNIAITVSAKYYELISYPIAFIGVLASVASLATAFTSKKAHQIENFFGEKRTLQIIQWGGLIGIFLMSLMIPYWGFLFMLIITGAAGLFWIVVDHYVNLHIPTSHRATMLSIKNLFVQFSIALLFPIIGYVTKFTSMGTGFLTLGIIGLISCISLAIYTKTLRLSQITN
ncbi:MAG: MFS transporter [Candidatus Nanoarchaeia archaeon]